MSKIHDKNPLLICLFALLILNMLNEKVSAQSLTITQKTSQYLHVDSIAVTQHDTVFSVAPSIIQIDTAYIVFQDSTFSIHYKYLIGRNQIVVESSPVIGSILILHTYKVPFVNDYSYAKRQKVYLVSDSTKKGQAVIESSSETADERLIVPSLFKSGSLTRSFAIGSNSGLELKSGLNMQIRGKLGDNYELKAVLTDQNVPLQPEGNTKTLNEIDNVYIDITGPGVVSRFGDFYLRKSGGQFASVSKKMTGVSLQSEYKNNDMSFAFATSEGQFHSMRILGLEGSQGPYLLTGKNNERRIIVLAGTEKVYIDGNVMVRGEDNDYVIDYTSAQITFTRNRLITGDSRIVIDFHYSDGNFKNSFYSVGMTNKVQDAGFSYSASIMREGDNKDNPQIGSFSESDLATLANVGDNPILSAEKSIRFVGDGQGTYKKVINGEIEYFEYADSADYRVQFSNVGDSNGDYEFERIGVYSYVGGKRGSYTPAVVLPLPKSHSVANVSLGFRDGNIPVHFNAEYALSTFDNNILSGKNDNDNNGSALALELGIVPSNVKLFGSSLGTASVTAKIRKTDERFNPLDRTTQVEFDRQWDLTEQTISGERIVEIEADYKPVSSVTIRPSLGSLKLSDRFNSNRQSVLVAIQNTVLPVMQYRIENVASENDGIAQDWLRQKGTASYRVHGFTPSVVFERESKNNTELKEQGFGFNDVSGKLQYDRNTNLTMYGIFQVRNDERYRGGIVQPYSKAENKSFFLEYKQNTGFYSRFNVVRRARTLHENNLKIHTNLADLKTQSSFLDGAVKAKMDIQMSREKIPQKEQVFLSVNEGEGLFSFDERSQEYIPDQNGTFRLRTFTTDKLIGVEREKVGVTLNFNPVRMKNLNESFHFLKNLRSTTIVRYENSTEDESGSTNTPSNRNPVFRRFNISQDLFLLEKQEGFNVRIRNVIRKTDNNQFIARSETRDTFEHSFRIRSRIHSSTTLESTVEYNRLFKNVVNNALLNHNLKTIKGDMTLTMRPTQSWRLALVTSVARQTDNISEFTQVSYFTLKPSLERGFFKTGRITGDVQWFHVRSRQGDYLPFDFAEGNQPGNNYVWSLNVNYRTTQNFNTSFKYLGNRKTRHDRTFHTMRAEMQILF